MSVFQSNDLDKAVLHELIEDINNQYKTSEAALLKLDHQPDDAVLAATLFRAVNTIKDNLAIVGFSPLMPLMDALEHFLYQLKAGTVSFNPMVSDLVLLILDRVRSFVENYRINNFAEYDQALMKNLGNSIEQITSAQPSDYQTLVAQTIQMLDPDVVAEKPADQPLDLRPDSGYERLGLTLTEDLIFFRELMVPVESRSTYWAGRGDRILKLSLIINNQAGRPVDPEQLAAAVYTHDFGMAFMPLELLHKDVALNNSEILLLRSHVQSSAHLLAHMAKWQEAKEIVLQHHEAVNGSGYPYGLREKEICDGAKILAIADSFDAITHQRAYTNHQRRPILRAIKEINECAGKQLSPQWVEVFNQVVEPVIFAHEMNNF